MAEGQDPQAAAAAAQVTAAAAAGDAVIAEEVATVADALEEHAEVSEERHEEILEGTQWLGRRVDQIQTEWRDFAQTIQNSMGTQQGQTEQLRQLQETQLVILQSLQTEVGRLNERLSPASSPSIPPESPAAETVIAVVTPESAAAAGQGEAKTEPAKRRRRVI